MFNGSRLESVSSPRSIGAFHSVQAYSEVFQAPFLCSPGLHGSEVNDAQVGSWRCCFVMSLFGDDSFLRGVMRWTG
jgi:hypothetical protein